MASRYEGLRGLRVLDFTQVLSGPFASMLLADAGSDVVKVERPPAGDITRQWGPPFVQEESLYFAAFNRGKKSLVADLTEAGDRALVWELARRADVVLENLRPGTLEKYGLGYADLRRELPGLIYVSIRGYRADSSRAQDPALEVVLEAESGLMAITGTGEPVRQGIAVIDMMTGSFAVARILDALYNRERTGRGQHVVLSLQETAELIMTHPYLAHSKAHAPYPPGGTTHPSIAPYEHFRTRDRPIILGAVNDPEFRRLATTLGHPEWTGGSWSTNAGRVADRARLHETLQGILITEPGVIWVERFRQAKLVVGLVRSLDLATDTWFHGESPKLVSHDDRYGTLTYPASPWAMDGEVNAAPQLGAHHDEIVDRWLGEKRVPE